MSLSIRIQKLLLLGAVTLPFVSGQAPVTVKVAEQLVPPGGGGQAQVLLTVPKPILTGSTLLDMDSVASIEGVSLFSPQGDVEGAATVTGKRVQIFASSPLASYGTDADYPLATVAFKVAPTAVVGRESLLSIGADLSLLTSLGAVGPFELKGGKLTIGGTLSITNVEPGGGLLAAGSVVHIRGTGFTPQTSVSVKHLSAVGKYVSPTEFQLVLKENSVMDGRKVTMSNPAGRAVTYYSYLRGVPAGESRNPLLAATLPIFSLNSYQEASFAYPSSLPAGKLMGVAFENAGSQAANVMLSLISPDGTSTPVNGFSLAPRYRMVREVAELTGVAFVPGAQLHIQSTQPLAMLGLLGDLDASSVLPVSVTPIGNVIHRELPPN